MLDRFGRREEAVAAYRAALEAFDRMSQAMTGMPPGDTPSEERMELLVHSGRTADAVAVATATLRRFADNIMMLAFRCAVRAEAGIDLPLAQRDCDQAIRAEPTHPIALPARALLNLRLQHWSEAIRDFTGALADEPQSARALYGRGLARLRSGDAGGGQADLTAARRLAFDIDWEYQRRGLAPPAAATP